MTTSAVVLALAVFGASCVEMVEALTIVVASGTSRGWRSALEGAAVAVLVLAAIVGAVGVPLIHLVPINALRVVVGALLLVLGLNWLRKAILRSSGHIAIHDEDLIYAKTVASLSGEDTKVKRRDAVGFVVAFKGVFLEGTEVVLIVLSLGSSDHRMLLASLSAAVAIVLVTGVGIVFARQLSEVPENAMKMSVGIMLCSFGIFWTGEGAKINWPGSDVFILALIGIFLVVTYLGIALMRHRFPAPKPLASAVEPS
jgi:uncharacterized membrane protein